MIKFRYLTIVSILTAFVLSGAPRSDALGNARPVLPEGSVVDCGNPAGLSLLKDHLFNLSFESPYAGIGEMFGYGRAGYSHRFRDFSAGVSVRFLQSEMFFDSEIGLGFAKRFGIVAAGVRIDLLYDSFRESNFHYGPGDYPDDPVFDDGYSGLAVSGDAGVIIKVHERASLGILVEDLIDPNRALVEGDESRKGRRFSAGISVDLGRTGIIYGHAGFAPSAPDGEEISFGSGFETNAIHPMLDMRVGVDNSDATMGIGIHLPTDIPLRFDYTFSYHLSDLRKASTGHGFAIVGRIAPKIVRPDLSMNISLDKDIYRIGDTALVSVTVENSQLKAEDVTMAFERNLVGSSVVDTSMLGDIHPESPWNRLFKVPLDEAGRIDFSATVDPDELIKERDESNNSASVSANVYGPPKIDVAATPNKLEIQKIRYVRQDESIVPMIFFEEGSDKIDNRFDGLLDLLVGRIENNPDMTIVIDGFYDPVSEPDMEDIAAKREKALRDAIVSRTPGSGDRIVIGEKDPGQRRILRDSEYEQYRRLVNEENRRAEIGTRIEDISYDVDPASFSDSQAESIAASLIPILRNNPLLTVVVRMSEKEISLKEAIARSLKIKGLLIDKMPSIYATRIFASASDDIPVGVGKVVLSGDAVVYQPKEVHFTSDFEPVKLPECKIRLSAESDLKLVRWKLILSYPESGEGWVIAEGKGSPPATQTWDWKDPDGGLVPFGKKFDLCFEVEDEIGQVSTVYFKDKIRAEITLREERTDKRLLVQFTFDAPAPQSRYLRDRLEIIAEEIVDRGSVSGVSIDVEIQGHTDNIGGQRRNEELSEERASTILSRLLAYMQSIIGLESVADLDRWMEENHVSVTSNGYAETRPYVLDLWRSGELVNVTIGDNELPDGRTINRRVIAVIHEIREKEAENE